ncbi:piggyBac transposable element-derived protein 4-like [Patiria miniata]|uniref:PiggyBac transposable element-derived protein domain-containing protein n=1 Tax=Patiria miniata TaxID=46514 RepID=A0A914B190_PATMI|nr:piggyBac transposable element-derived protein 4-like [Patiria miniata]
MASTSRHPDIPESLPPTLQDDIRDSDVESLMSEESGSVVADSQTSDEMSCSEESGEDVDSNGNEDGDVASILPPKKRPLPTPPNGRLQKEKPSRAAYVSPSGDTWTSDAPSTSRRRKAKVMMEAAGPKNLEGAKSKLQLFQLFITTGMMNAILMHTNEEGLRQRGRAWSGDVAMMELTSAIGLLLFLGLTKSGREKVRSFWRQGPFARPLCMATMTGTRFQDILTLMRFDSKATGEARRKNDKFAPIRSVFDEFASSCRRYYSAGECVTVDEQLVAFRGRCPFRQYMPRKPAKYGIKFWACVDVDSHYVLNIIPYLGKEAEGTRTNLGASVVKELMQPMYNIGRNVTTDNYFTSAALAKDLLKKNLTLVGTIRGSRREVPKEVRRENVKTRAAKSSRFLFNEDLTLVSFIPRENRSVLLLSSMHHDKKINPDTQKPDIIHFYNKTKGGVDTVDQMCSVYSCLRKTKRWPMTVFYNLLNLAALNAYALWRHLNPAWAKRENSRHDFLHGLIMDLVRPQIELRAANPRGLHASTTSAMAILNFTVQYNSKQPKPDGAEQAKMGDCHECPPRRQGGRRTPRSCKTCNRFVCKEHSMKFSAVACRSCHYGEF